MNSVIWEILFELVRKIIKSCAVMLLFVGCAGPAKERGTADEFLKTFEQSAPAAAPVSEAKSYEQGLREGAALALEEVERQRLISEAEGHLQTYRKFASCMAEFDRDQFQSASEARLKECRELMKEQKKIEQWLKEFSEKYDSQAQAGE